MMRSAWIKWARGVEHQRGLARELREFSRGDTYDYIRFDNAGNRSDPLVKMYWVLRVRQPYPERWSVLVGDILTNLRAALDHTFWAATITATGMPARPQLVTFPLYGDKDKFKSKAKDLQHLVAPEFWELVEAVQPFHADQPDRVPLDSLRWLSNVDKHRAVHIVGRTAFDAGPIITDSEYEIIDDERIAGEVSDGSVVARLRFRRPANSTDFAVHPTFEYSPSLQVNDSPEKFVPLDVVMDAINEDVLGILAGATRILGEEFPDPESLNVGMDQEAIAAEFGGAVVRFRSDDGTIHRFAVPLNTSEEGITSGAEDASAAQ
ncbi:hypothetical protein [Nocardia fusca]|uniref:hypothetical protein n=1 Tax=Nocardia fusca TaxID=941183 RepID=UPI0007A75754|nr:hypothetical protein [Nocardia fusca]